MEYLSNDISNPKMEPHEGSFCLGTFNCRSVKSSVPEVSQLCAKCDILVLQEHWLLPNDLDFLNNIHPDFLAFGQSSVDISDRVLIGRPYGGTAILYRKSFSSCVARLHSSDPRVTAVSLQTKIGPVLIACVYMPTDNGTADCFEEFIATCANVSALFFVSDFSQAVEIFMSDESWAHGVFVKRYFKPRNGAAE